MENKKIEIKIKNIIKIIVGSGSHINRSIK